MLSERRGSNASVKQNGIRSGKNNPFNEPNSAEMTARLCPSESKLRVPCFCEENVWRLAHRRLYRPLIGEDYNDEQCNDGITTGKENEEYYVTFISNEKRCCPMMNQQASESPSTPCFWDYHVILIQCTKGRKITDAKVLDLDSRLPYSCSLQQYLDGTFGDLSFQDDIVGAKYAPIFRVIRAEMYLRHFYSDRRHMLKSDGAWAATPPKYDCMTTSDMVMNENGCQSNLDEYISMCQHKGDKIFGEVFTLDQLQSKFGS